MILSRHTNRSIWRVGRTATVCFAVAGYFFAVVGVPLPVARVKDASQLFPCMDRPCGCKDALQCWKSCCCTTPAERLQWARSHGVEPPAELAVLAAKSAAHAEPRRACCAHKHEHSSEAQARAGHGESAPASADEAAHETADFVVISALRQCNGLAPLWSFLAAALAAPEAAHYRFDWTVAGWLSLASECAEFSGASPPTPPPRV